MAWELWHGLAAVSVRHLTPFQPSDLTVPLWSSQGPWRCWMGLFSLLFLVVQGVTADASQLPSPTGPTRTGV